MKILFITSGSIGDAVMSTGLLGHLLERYKQADFTIASGPAAAPLFEAFPRLERLLVVRKQPRKKHWLTLWNETRRQHWDMVVDLRGSLLSFLLRAKKRYIFHSAAASKSKLDQLGALLGLHPSPLPRLWVSAAATAQARAMLPATPVIAMIPISNSAFKDWPIERFGELGQRLLTMPPFATATIAVLGLASQQPLLRPLLEALPPSRILDLSGKTDVPLACAILKEARLVIGNDSGMLHMAGALNTPLVGLYGPTNDVKYAPRGPHVRIAKVREFAVQESEIHDPSLIRRLTVDSVEALARELLASPPYSAIA